MQGFCPLNIKITQFADGFHLNNADGFHLNNYHPPISCSIIWYTLVKTSCHLTINFTTVGREAIKGSCPLLITGLSLLVICSSSHNLRLSRSIPLYSIILKLFTVYITVKREWGQKIYLKHYDWTFYLKFLYFFTIISQIKEARQSDKSPVGKKKSTQQRKIEVRYMAFVFHLHQESKAL